MEGNLPVLGRANTFRTFEHLPIALGLNHERILFCVEQQMPVCLGWFAVVKIFNVLFAQVHAAVQWQQLPFDPARRASRKD